MNSLPAGLEDNSVEIYRFENKAHALYNGSTHKYFELPEHIRLPFHNDYENDKEAQECLEIDMCISGDKAREEKFIACRYGNFDRNPDLADGKLEADAPNCSEERICPGLGIVCKLPEGKNGRLTKQQYFITKLIAMGKQDKEIAFELYITLPTVRTHLTRIRETLDVNNRNEISLWAINKGII